MNEMETVRSAQVIGSEIRALTYQAKCMTLYFGVEIGRRLAEAKALLEHGEYGKWLKEEAGFSTSSAARFVKLYEEYGAEQIGIFGAETKFPTLGNLSISNALRLLALPEEERETFAEEHDVEHMSTRELDELLRQVEEARENAEGDARRIAELEKAFEDATEEIKELKENIEELESRPVEVAVEKADPEEVERAVRAAVEDKEQQMHELRAVLDEQTKKTAELEAALEAEKDKLSKAKSDLKEAKAGVAAAKEQGAAESGDALRQATAEAEAAKSEAERLRRELLMSDTVTTEFRVRFAAMQTEMNACMELIERAAEENRPKLRAAIRAALEGGMKRVEVEA